MDNVQNFWKSPEAQEEKAMYTGTMIDDLLGMVERAEEKAAAQRAKREKERQLITWYVSPEVDWRERAREAMRVGAA